MNKQLIDLAVKRGELKAKIAMQRDELGRHVWPVEKLLGTGDKAVAGVRWLKQHPGAIVAAVAAIVVVRPKRAWQAAVRLLVLWRGVTNLRGRLGIISDLFAGLQQRR